MTEEMRTRIVVSDVQSIWQSAAVRLWLLQIETPLEEASRLSQECGNSILLKREDMQSVSR